MKIMHLLASPLDALLAALRPFSSKHALHRYAESIMIFKNWVLLT